MTFNEAYETTPPVGATKPVRMTSSSLYKAAMSEPSKTQVYNPRRAEMDLYREKDLSVLKPAIDDLFEKLGQAFTGTALASKIGQLNTFKQQIDKLISNSEK